MAGVVSSAAQEPLGSAAEEAARLVDSFQGWFGARAGSAPDARPREAPVGPEEPTPDAGPQAAPGRPEEPAHGPACRACPVCRGLAYVRQTHPEVVEHLATAAQHVAEALRALAADAAERPEATEPRSERPAPAEPDRPPRPAGPAADDRGNRDGHRFPSRAVRIVVEPDPDLPNSGPSEQEPEP